MATLVTKSEIFVKFQQKESQINSLSPIVGMNGAAFALESWVPRSDNGL